MAQSEVSYTPLFHRPRWRAVIIAICIVVVLAIAVILLVTLIPKYVKTSSGTSSIVIHGHWSDWKPWSECSKTCGGGSRSRDRNCSNPAPMNGGNWCVGNSTESQPCAVWSCPNCSRECPEGGTLIDCAICSCPGEVLSGEVHSEGDNFPLAGVKVYSSQKRWIPLALTNVTGHFEVSDICLRDLRMEFTGIGFIPTSKLISVLPDETSARVSIAMVKMVRPHFILHPVSQALFAGSSLDLSCEATGIPMPHRYEWFLNGSILTWPSNNSTLQIPTVQMNHSGIYTCRAVSPAGKVFSKEAKILVKDSGRDTCQEVPETRYVALPATCYYQDADGVRHQSVNMGHCVENPCVTPAEPQNSRCCGPLTSESVPIRCSTFQYEMFRMTSCGCVACATNVNDQRRITGRILTQDEAGLNPVMDIAYKYDGYYDYSNNGYFNLEVSSQEDRIIMEFDTNHNHHLPQTKVLRLYPGVDEGYTVILQGFSQVAQAAPHEEQRIAVDGFQGYPSAVTLTLPSGSLLSASGEPLDENVHIFVGFSDPRDAANIEAAPGEFTYETEEGFIRQLETYGVIQLHAQKLNGEEVVISGEIEIEVNSEFLGIEDNDGSPDALLWILDETTGRWREAGELTYNRDGRRKRQATGGIARGQVSARNSTVTLNIDKPIFERGACQVKVAVYGSEDLKSTVKNIELLAYTLSSNGLGYIGSTQGRTNHRGTACVLIPCGYIHEVFARSTLTPIRPHSSHHLPPGFAASNAGEGVKFRSPDTKDIQDGKGPVHRYSADTCHQTHAPDYHFQFVMGVVYDIGTLYEIYPTPGQELSWYQEPADSPNRTVCMIRIEVDGIQQLDVISTSHQRNKEGPIYGTFITRLRTFYDVEYGRERRFACIQVRCANHDWNEDYFMYEEGFGKMFPEGDGTDYVSSGAGNEQPPTYVDVHLLQQDTSSCEFTTLAPNMTPEESLTPPVYFVNSTKDTASFLLTPDGYNNYRMVFFAARGNHNSAYHDVLNQCITSWSSLATYRC